MIEIRRLHKTYSGRTVLDIPLLHLHAGESYVLSGDNGAGKSTLLRVLAGLEPARMQSYRFRGEEMDQARLPPRVRMQIGYVHQHPYMFNTSVHANVEYGLRVRGVAAGERKERLREALAWAGVQDLAAMPAQQLSGGEQQRVALARLKALSPCVYLLDEPTANLDADGRRRVIELLSRLAGADNMMLIACHDQEVINLPGVARLHLTEGKLDSMPERGVPARATRIAG